MLGVVRRENASVGEDQMWRIINVRLRSMSFVWWAVDISEILKQKDGMFNLS